MNKERLKHLMHQYFNNTISAADCIELLGYLNTIDPKKIDDVIDGQLLVSEEGPEFSLTRAHEVFERIKSDSRFTTSASSVVDQSPKNVKLYQQYWFKVAAIVIVCFTAGFYFLRVKDTALPEGKFVKKEVRAVILPGKNKATLTLANGHVIALEAAKKGVLAKSENSSVRKTDNGSLVYDNMANTGSNNATGPVYNILATPKGGEYQVTLPDGTKVWLNSYSSLSFPVAFPDKERRVKLNGEAYFEVAKDKEKPFYVNINDVTVRVFGTHFNISAYGEDKQITTTLLEGSVQVAKNNKKNMLKAGQQAVIASGSDMIKVSSANLNEVMAWKNGYFIFSDENITAIMKQVSRWYDVEVEYRGNIGDQRFGGTFYRSKSIDELLHHLEKIGKIHFKISGRRVVVME